MATLGRTALVGDSLTEAGRWEEWIPEAEVLNLGVSGNTSDDVVARIDEIADAEPETIVLLIGTNDLAYRKGPEHVVRNIETILVTLRKRLPDAQILVQSVLPRAPEFAPRIQDINRHLWQFAPTVRAQYLDLWPALSADGTSLDPAYSDDALHLNDAGYRAWVDELVPALEALHGLPPSSRPISLNRLKRLAEEQAAGQGAPAPAADGRPAQA